MKGPRYLGWIAVVALLLLLFLPVPLSWRVKFAVRDELAPFRNFLGLLVTGAGRLMDAVTSLREAASEKERMSQELAALREEVRLLKGLREENEELREMLELKRKSPLRLLACEVVARGDSTGWWRTIELGKGANHGILPGMAVLSKGALIGRTWEVTETSTTVLLITDPMFRVSCRFSRAGCMGILQGRGAQLPEDGVFALAPPRPFNVEYVSKAYRILQHDEVVTSGLGDVFPDGLLIGYSVRSILDSSGLYQRVDVAPAADLSDLRRVFVVMD